ncbi:membrane protein insertase YidC [Myxococcota bacterium]|nr:membrane protein insertase YidC [Myxococcota bacterium]
MKPEKNELDQRAIVAVLLSLAVLWVWGAMNPQTPPVTTPEGVPPVAGETPAGGGGAPVAGGDPAVPTPIAPAVVPDRLVPIGSAEITAQLSSQGGALTAVVLPNQEANYDVTPIWRHVIGKVTGSASPEWAPYGGAPGPERLLSETGALLVAGSGPGLTAPGYTLEGSGPWTATGLTAEGLSVTKVWSTTNDPNRLRVVVRFENAGATNYTGPVWLGSWDKFAEQEDSYSSVTRPVAVVDGDLETLLDLTDVDDEVWSVEGPVSWFGVGDRYFLGAAIPDDPAWGKLSFVKVDAERQGVRLTRDVLLKPGEHTELGLEVYIGGKSLERLSAIGHDLDDAVDLGFFGLFGRVLLWVLGLIHGLVGSWGMAIILLTVGVKLLFWPLTRASFVSSRKMAALSPRIEELRQQYKDDPQKAGAAQMELFAKEGVNPLSGCLPVLVQTPVWIALYSALLYSSELYHAEFFYLKDLASADPYGILPTIIGVLMMLQQRMTPMSPGMDPLQQRIIRLMPLIFVGIMYAFPSGLALYSFVNTVLSILQMWLINRSIPAVMPAVDASSKATP